MSNEEIVKLIQGGECRYYRDLWEQNRGLIKQALKPFAGNQYYEDLEQEAFLAMVSACSIYDSSRGVLFSSFLFTSIKRQAIAYIRNNCGDMRYPRDYKEMQEKYPALLPCMRLDRPLKEDGTGQGMTIGEMIPSGEKLAENVTESIYNSQRAQEVNCVLQELPEDERKVIIERFYGEKELKEIAAEIGENVSKCQSLKEKAFRQLKKNKVMKKYGDDIISHAFRGSLNNFNITWESSTEHAALKMYEMDKRRK